MPVRHSPKKSTTRDHSQPLRAEDDPEVSQGLVEEQGGSQPPAPFTLEQILRAFQQVSSQASPQPRLGAFHPPKYNGQQPVDDWYGVFARLAQLCKIPQGEWLLHMIGACEGEAAQVASNFLLSNEADLPDAHLHLLAKAKAYFTSHNLPAWHSYSALRPTSLATFKSYLIEKFRKATVLKVEPDRFMADVIKDLPMELEKFAIYLLSEKPQSEERLLAVYALFEETVGLNAETTKTNAPVPQAAAAFGSARGEQPLRAMTCFGCGKTGHMARNCPLRRPTPTPQAKRICAMSNNFQRAVIDGLPVDAYIDGGSDVSAIKEEIAEQLNHIRPYEGEPILDAENGELNITGVITATLDYKGQKKKQDLLVMPKLFCNVLLGTDFLGAENASLQSNKTLTQYPKELCLARVRYWTRVPPNSALFVPILIDVPDGTYHCAMRFCCKPGMNYVLPSALIHVLHGRSDVLICNIEDMPISLKANTRIPLEALDETGVIDIGQRATSPQRILRMHRSCGDATPPPVAASKDDFLRDMKMGSHLNAKERGALQDLLYSYRHLFGKSLDDLGCTGESLHEVNTGDARPLHQPARRTSYEQRLVIRKEVQNMLDHGVIQESSSPWSSPVVLIKKKDGTIRFCVDYRRLNNVTKKDVFPLPRIDDTVDRLAGNVIFTTLDLLSGYWQVQVHPRDQEKTAFVTPDGLYEFTRLPFGMCNAPATFQRLMNKVLGRMRWEMAMVYLDDVVIFSRNFTEHLRHLEAVFQALLSANLKVKPQKCLFGSDKIVYLGHQVSGEGVSPDPNKLACLTAYNAPRSVKELKSFLGFASYFRKFIPNFASRAHPLYRLLKKDATFGWTDVHNASFLDLKAALTTAPLLRHFDNNLPTMVHTDASGSGLGAVLLQKDGNGKEQVVAYASKKLTPEQAVLHATELELMAVHWALTDKFRPYLYGRTFEVVTDNAAIKYLHSKRELSAKLERWAMELQDFTFSVVHRSGKAHGDADFLSRVHQDFHRIAAIRLGVNLRERQRAHPPYREKLDLLDRGTTVLDEVTERKLADVSKHFACVNGVLYHRGKAQQRPLRLCVTPSDRRELLKAAHDDNFHPGLRKTMRLLAERYYWLGMRRDVEEYGRACKKCQETKTPPGKPEGRMQPIRPPTSPWELVGLDFLGPFPSTQKGNKYIVAAIDYHTRYLVAEAVRASTTAIATAFLARLMASFGRIGDVITDPASYFKSARFKEFLSQ